MPRFGCLNKLPAVVVTLLVFLVICLQGGCAENDNKTLKVGFVGCLSGKCSDLGVAGRDGAILAMEEVNSKGGIVDRKGQSRQIELVSVDTQGSMPVAAKELRRLVDEGVKVVIGPMTSQAGVELKPIADATETVLLAPTISTTKVSRLDDYLFRVYLTCDVTAPALARYAVDVDKLQSFAIAYDEVNAAFVDPWIEYFRAGVVENGGKIVGIQPLSGTLPMLDYARRIHSMDADGVLVIANAFNTGLFIQQLEKLGSNARVLGTEWSTTSSLEEFSGRALEGAYFVSSFNDASDGKRYRDFLDNHEKRFNKKAAFATKFSYEAMAVLLAALQKNPNLDLVKESLMKTGSVAGLQGKIELDQYGDIIRDVYIKEYRDRRFRTVAKLNNGDLHLLPE